MEKWEVLVTNLDADRFPLDRMKELCKLRWGIEKSFKTLKDDDCGIQFHSKKDEFVKMELYARYGFPGYMIEHDGQQLADSAGRLGATNNEMEMTAFLESLKRLEQLGLTQQHLLFVLKSQYVIKSVSDTNDGPAWIKSWKKRDWKTANGKPVANQELWQDIDRELAKFDSSKLKFAWLRSTFSDAGSDFVDSLLMKRMAE